MVINIRTWNMNYWKERRRCNPKTEEQKNAWIDMAGELVLQNKDIDIFSLQESSVNMLGKNKVLDIVNEHRNHTIIKENDMQFIYHTNPNKYPDWGLLIISKYCNGNCFVYDNELSYICYDFNIEDKY
jgi:hypothetical protein